jgi:hypothetical protein
MKTQRATKNPSSNCSGNAQCAGFAPNSSADGHQLCVEDQRRAAWNDSTGAAVTCMPQTFGFIGICTTYGTLSVNNQMSQV